MNQRTLARRGLSALAGTPRKHLLALAVGACFAAPSHAGPVANGRYNIVAVHSGKCVDVDNAGTADGTPIQQYTCNGTDAQVFFTILDSPRP